MILEDYKVEVSSSEELKELIRELRSDMATLLEIVQSISNDLKP